VFLALLLGPDWSGASQPHHHRRGSRAGRWWCLPAVRWLGRPSPGAPTAWSPTSPSRDALALARRPAPRLSAHSVRATLFPAILKGSQGLSLGRESTAALAGVFFSATVHWSPWSSASCASAVLACGLTATSLSSRVGRSMRAGFFRERRGVGPPRWPDFPSPGSPCWLAFVVHCVPGPGLGRAPLLAPPRKLNRRRERSASTPLPRNPRRRAHRWASAASRRLSWGSIPPPPPFVVMLTNYWAQEPLADALNISSVAFPPNNAAVLLIYGVPSSPLAMLGPRQAASWDSVRRPYPRYQTRRGKFPQSEDRSPVRNPPRRQNMRIFPPHPSAGRGAVLAAGAAGCGGAKPVVEGAAAAWHPASRDHDDHHRQHATR